MSEVKQNNTNISGKSQQNNKIGKKPYLSKSKKNKKNKKKTTKAKKSFRREITFDEKYIGAIIGTKGRNIKALQKEYSPDFQLLMSNEEGKLTIIGLNDVSKRKVHLDFVTNEISNKINQIIEGKKIDTSKVYETFTVPSEFANYVLSYYTFKNIYKENNTFAKKGDTNDGLTKIHVFSNSNDNIEDINLCIKKLKLQILTNSIEDLESIEDLVLKNAFCYGIKKEMDDSLYRDNSLYVKLEEIIPKILNSTKSYPETEFQDKDNLVVDDWNESITKLISDDYQSFIGDKKEYYAVKDVMNPTFDKYKYVPSECMYLPRNSSLSEWETKRNPYGAWHDKIFPAPPELLTKYRGFSAYGEIDNGWANGHWVIPSERFSYERVSKYCYAENYFGGLGGNYMEYLAAIYINKNSEKICCQNPLCNKKGTIKHNGGIYTSHQDFICTSCGACYELKAKANRVCDRLRDHRNNISDLSVYGGSFSSFDEQKNQGKKHYILLMECGDLLKISHNESDTLYSCLFEPNLSLNIYCGRIHECIPRISEKTIAQVNSGCENPSIKCKYYFSKLKHWVTVEVPPDVKNYNSFKNTIMESEFGSSARKIQRLYRKHLEKKTKAIRVIQKLYKNRINVRVKSANVLQNFWRKYLKNKPFDWKKWALNQKYKNSLVGFGNWLACISYDAIQHANKMKCSIDMNIIMETLIKWNLEQLVNYEFEHKTFNINVWKMLRQQFQALNIINNHTIDYCNMIIMTKTMQIEFGPN